MITQNLAARIVLLMSRAGIGADLLYRSTGIRPHKIAGLRRGDDVALTIRQIALIADVLGADDREILYDGPVEPFDWERKRYLKERAEQIAARRKEARELAVNHGSHYSEYLPEFNHSECDNDGKETVGSDIILSEVQENAGLSGHFPRGIQRAYAVAAGELPRTKGQTACRRANANVRHRVASKRSCTGGDGGPGSGGACAH